MFLRFFNFIKLITIILSALINNSMLFQLLLIKTYLFDTMETISYNLLSKFTGLLPCLFLLI